MHKKFKPGQLVEVLLDQVASYSNHGGRPPMFFRKGMLGVVRVHHENGIQVEFFAPETGLMEACHCMPDTLKSIAWPAGLTDLREKYVLHGNACSASAADWYFCGSMGPKSAINYLRAVAILDRAYYDELHVDTLRIPGYHSSRLRSAEPAPSCFLAECAGGGSYHRAVEIKAELDALIRQPLKVGDPATA